MRSNFVMLVALSAVLVFLSTYGTSYVNGQTSAVNSSSVENETGSANSVLNTDDLDPFKSKTSSNNLNDNPSQADVDTSANRNNDDNSIANDDSTTNDNNNNNDDSSNNNNDKSDKDDSADDNSSDEDKESKDDRKFELPFP